MAVETHLFRCRSDNFGVLIRDTETGAVAAIDAPESLDGRGRAPGRRAGS